MILMAKACYNPAGAIELWERYNAVRNVQGNKGYFIMHPPPDHRIVELVKINLFFFFFFCLFFLHSFFSNC